MQMNLDPALLHYYVYVDYGDDIGLEPHMSFTKDEKEEAEFEIRDLKDSGYKAKFGAVFKPFPKDTRL